MASVSYAARQCKRLEEGATDTIRARLSHSLLNEPLDVQVIDAVRDRDLRTLAVRQGTCPSASRCGREDGHPPPR
jgi:hypothetical protein